MSKISIGKKCSLCGRVHLVKTLDALSEKERRKLVKLDHHIFDRGYIGSLVKDDEVWEFYGPLVTKEVRIEISAPESKEEETIDQAYEGDFEGSYTYYDGEDVLAEEEDP